MSSLFYSSALDLKLTIASIRDAYTSTSKSKVKKALVMENSRKELSKMPGRSFSDVLNALKISMIFTSLI